METMTHLMANNEGGQLCLWKQRRTMSVLSMQHYLHLHCFSEPGINGMRLHLFQFANADNTSAAVQSGQPVSVLLLNTDITEHYRLLSACEITGAALIF